jgi:hypothetical protein
MGSSASVRFCGEPVELPAERSEHAIDDDLGGVTLGRHAV